MKSIMIESLANTPDVQPEFVALVFVCGLRRLARPLHDAVVVTPAHVHPVIYNVTMV